MKTDTPIFATFHDAEFEQKFEQFEREQQPLMEVLGRQHGGDDKPKTKQEYFVLVLNNLRSSGQSLLEFNHSRFQPTADVASIQDMRNQAEEKIRGKETEKKEAAIKEAIIETEQKELKRKLNRKISSRMRIFIPVLFGICEGVVTYDMLKSSSMPTLVSFFLALLTSLAAAFGTFLGANFITKTITPLKRKIRHFIVLVIGFAVAVALGIWRGISYSNISQVNAEIELSESAATGFSPWPFIIITFVGFVVALAFELYFWANEEERRFLRKYNENKRDLKILDGQIQQINFEIEKIGMDLRNNSAITIRKLEYAKSNEHRLLNLAEQLKNRYESLNIEYRRENTCPEFFGEPLSGFKTYFVQLFQKIQHANQ